jgi:hypothetical protein
VIVKSKTVKKPTTAKRKGSANSARTTERAEAREDQAQSKVLETVLTEVTKQPETEHLEEWVQVPCPYCAEEFEVHVTSEQDGQSMYEDCEVCSRSISLHIQVEEGELIVEAYRS